MRATALKNNLTYLESNFRDFYKNLVDQSLLIPELSVDETGQPGNYKASLGNVTCFLHSSFNIEREMEMLFSPLAGEENQVIVIFGLGYGHCLDYIRKRRVKYKRVVVFEPCSNIFLKVLERRTIRDLLGLKDLYLRLLNVPNDMARFLLYEALESKTIKILFHLSYMSLFHDIFDNVLRSFRNERIMMNTSVHTMRSKMHEWNSQQLKSIQLSNPSAAAFEGKFSNVPAIVASAGPSLEKHLDLLRDIGDRAVVVAPGSTIRIFKAQKLSAHIAMSIDSHAVQAEFLNNYTLGRVLIASYRLHPDALKAFPNRVFNVALSTEYLAKYYCDWSGRKPLEIDDHASVSMAAVDMLHLMGCNPVILIGQDLSFTDNRNHADRKPGSLTERQMQRRIPDKDIYGNDVYTDHGYKSMQNDLETQNIRYRDKMKIYNATEGGLNIHGIENVKFADVYNRFINARPNDVARRIDDILNAVKADGTDMAGGVITDGGTDGGGGYEKPVITDFIGHLLAVCADIEKLITEKNNGFLQFVKLTERGLSNNRLNAEMKYIQDFNKKLDAIPFFQKVVYPNIEASLTFIRAGGKYISDSGEDWEGAVIFEQKLNEHASDFINTFKALLLREIVTV